MPGPHLHRTLVAFTEIRRCTWGITNGAGGPGGHRPLFPVLQLRTAASEPAVSNAGGSLPEPERAIRNDAIRKKSFVDLGALPPNPRNLPLSGQNGCFSSTKI